MLVWWRGAVSNYPDEMRVLAGDPLHAVVARYAAPLRGPWISYTVDAPTVYLGGAGQRGDTFWVFGGGGGIGGAEDGFHYTARPLAGDATLTARVSELASTAPDLRAGLMMRATHDRAAAHAFVGVTRDGAAMYQRRWQVGGDTRETWTTAAGRMEWLRLERRGDVFTASVSRDGQAWTPFASDRIALGPTPLEGVAITTAQRGVYGTARVDLR